jgi:hypothetical protein
MLQLIIRDRSFTIRELGHSSSTNVLVIERVSSGGVQAWDLAVGDRENPLMSENIIEKVCFYLIECDTFPPGSYSCVLRNLRMYFRA